eukprot:TRINITY_DN833_c0_g1_i1.p1 TRINITY_DN833_c0_g1~~TRINITY_DN833_c0_g1_i1.p1  ORF type:complete len:256 (+),score=79.42 TRINITY_DN833_c0_g1_i1:107-874(+)
MEFPYLLVIGVLFLFLLAKVYFEYIGIKRTTPKPAIPQHKLNPSSTIFAFDLHSVIFFFNFKECLSMLLITKEGWKFLVNIASLAFYPRVVLSIVRMILKPEGCVAEEVVDMICSKVPKFLDFRPFIVGLINCFVPDEHTVKVIFALKEKQYSVYLFSNIGEGIFEDLHDKHQQIFAKLDGFFVCTSTHNWTRKPSPRAFSLFVEKFNKEGRYIIFIDDQRKNLDAAQKADHRFHGVHFVEGRRLLEDLTNWNLI